MYDMYNMYRYYTATVFLLHMCVLKISGSRSRGKSSKLYLRPQGTTYRFKIRPDSRWKFPESYVGVFFDVCFS